MPAYSCTKESAQSRQSVSVMFFSCLLLATRSYSASSCFFYISRTSYPGSSIRTFNGRKHLPAVRDVLRASDRTIARLHDPNLIDSRVPQDAVLQHAVVSFVYLFAALSPEPITGRFHPDYHSRATLIYPELPPKMPTEENRNSSLNVQG